MMERNTIVNMIDPETGLPELPEGYFFRVHTLFSGSRFHYVTIYRKVEKRHFFFWTRTEDHKQIFSEMVHDGLNERSILRAARGCLDQWAEWKTGNPDLLGDYPPKKLGA